MRATGVAWGSYGGGEPGLRSLGLWEPVPSSNEVLRKYGETVVDALARPGLALNPINAPIAASFDGAASLVSLRPLVAALASALDEVSKEAAELGGTQVAKDAAMKTHNASFVRIAGLVEQLARAAGLDEVAHRIRPSVSDPGVLIDVRESAPDPEPVTPDDGPFLPGT